MIIIPYLNPVFYTLINPVEIPAYVSKHMDDWPFEDTIMPWETTISYIQPWQFSDSLRQQLQSDVGPLRLRLFDCEGRVWFDDNFQQRQASLNMADMFIYESDLALSLVTGYPGRYYLRLDVGSPVGATYISNIFYIDQKIINTLLLRYVNHKFYGDVVFEKGFSPSIRTYGRLKLKAPEAKDTIYEDQILNTTILDSKPYRLWELQLSSAGGVPPWLINKLNWILGCSNLAIDGRLYTKAEGSKLEPTLAPNYPMAGWSIEMREKLNRSSIIYTDTGVSLETAAVVANTDSKGFGQDDSGGSIYQVLDVN